MNHQGNERDAIPANWDDLRYVAENTDVKAAIEAGTFVSGYDHYVNFGVIEGRSAAWVGETSPNELWPWSDSAYLSTNRNLLHSLPERGMTPQEHYRQFGQKEGRWTGLEWMPRELSERAQLPDWAVKEMLQASFFEPALDAENFMTPWIYNPFREGGNGDETASFARPLQHAGETLTHKKYDVIFFLPWIKKGGADLASLFHIRSVAKRYRRVAVFTTEPATSEWASRVPKSVDLVHLGDHFCGSDVYKALVCYHLIVALQPQKVHIINSYPAWQMLKSFSRAVRSITEIYVSLYCYDYSDIGEPVGYARDVRKCIDGISGIFTDNTTFRNHLVNDLGIDAGLINVLRHPVSHDIPCVPTPARTNTRILWASRLDRQKQPTILTKIARSLPGFTFDVYGTGVQGEDSAVIEELSKCENIRYKGAFESVQDLPLEDYRCFLYTSLWDGLPNVLLEMLAAGMLVVTSDVGGIGCDLGEQAIVLVEDPQDPIQYAKALRWCFQNPHDAEAIRIYGQSFVESRHTVAGFEATLEDAGYLPRLSTVEARHATDCDAGDRVPRSGGPGRLDVPARDNALADRYSGNGSHG